jgi:hypothetical protein
VVRRRIPDLRTNKLFESLAATTIGSDTKGTCGLDESSWGSWAVSESGANL